MTSRTAALSAAHLCFSLPENKRVLDRRSNTGGVDAIVEHRIQRPRVVLWSPASTAQFATETTCARCFPGAPISTVSLMGDVFFVAPHLVKDGLRDAGGNVIDRFPGGHSSLHSVSVEHDGIDLIGLKVRLVTEARCFVAKSDLHRGLRSSADAEVRRPAGEGETCR